MRPELDDHAHSPGWGIDVNRTAVIWLLGVLGWVVSYAFFFKWMAANEWSFLGGWVTSFTGPDFNTGFLADLVAVTSMMVVLAIADRRRLGPRWTVAVIAALALSVSMSLAIYLVATWRAEGAPKE